MTVAQWVPGHCPQCRAVNTVELDSSTRICLECRCEWDPVTVVEPFTPPLAAVPDQVEDDGTPPGVVILGTPAEREEPSSATVELLAPPPDPHDPLGLFAEARSRLLGATVMVHEVDAEGTVSEIDSDGYAIVGFGSGFSIRCAPDEFTVTDATVIEDETIAALATTYTTIAAQVLRAGAETIDTSSEPRRLSVPPDGWLPEDPDVMPVIEAGAAYAIATLAIMAGISTDDLSALADGLDNAAGAVEGANNP